MDKILITIAALLFATPVMASHIVGEDGSACATMETITSRAEAMKAAFPNANVALTTDMDATTGKGAAILAAVNRVRDGQDPLVATHHATVFSTEDSGGRIAIFVYGSVAGQFCDSATLTADQVKQVKAILENDFKEATPSPAPKSND